MTWKQLRFGILLIAWIYCGFNNDYWRYSGKTVKSTDFVLPSRPVSFDEEKLMFTTLSGNLYRIIDFGGNKDEIIAQIKLDIVNECFERY